MILAGIDIGTNTLRLLIAETDGTTFREIESARDITRLGRGLEHSGELSREAWKASLDVLDRYAAAVRRRGAAGLSAAGTSALRNARNARLFIDDVKARTGIPVSIITGEEEARLTLLGVAAALRQAVAPSYSVDSAVVADIGGGSTEIIMTRGDAAPEVVSLHLGAVYLTERFIRRDPPGVQEVEDIRAAARKEFSKVSEGAGGRRPDRCIGTAGTITTLAAIDQALIHYDPARINGHVLAGEALSRIVARLATSTLAERRAVPGLEPGREDIILAGAIVAQEILSRWGFDRMLVSDWGLREGIVLDLYGKLRKGIGQRAKGKG